MLIAYPSYQQHLLKVKHSEAQQALWSLAAKMEQYASAQQSYAGATLAKVGANPQTPHNYYTLRIVTEKLTADYYLLEAVPNFDDVGCGRFWVDSLGEQENSGNILECKK